MRIFVAAFSVLILLWATLTLLRGDEDDAAATTRALTQRGRSWWRWVVTLFSGELIWAYYHRGEPPAADVADEVAAKKVD